MATLSASALRSFGIGSTSDDPVVVGDGLRLFPERGQTHNLEVVDARSTSSGVMLQTYRPAGRATFGDAGE